MVKKTTVGEEEVYDFSNGEGADLRRPVIRFEAFSQKCAKAGVRLIVVEGGAVLAERGFHNPVETTFDEWRD